MFGGGGSGKSGDNLVSAAREAREERAAIRRKETAAIKIQATIRGFVARQKYLRQIRYVDSNQ